MRVGLTFVRYGESLVYSSTFRLMLSISSTRKIFRILTATAINNLDLKINARSWEWREKLWSCQNRNYFKRNRKEPDKCRENKPLLPTVIYG